MNQTDVIENIPAVASDIVLHLHVAAVACIADIPFVVVPVLDQHMEEWHHCACQPEEPHREERHEDPLKSDHLEHHRFDFRKEALAHSSRPVNTISSVISTQQQSYLNQVLPFWLSDQWL